MSESGLNWGRIARRIRVPLGFVFAVVFFWLARPTLSSIAAGACVVALGVWIRAIASGHVDKNAALAMSGEVAGGFRTHSSSAIAQSVSVGARAR